MGNLHANPRRCHCHCQQKVLEKPFPPVLQPPPSRIVSAWRCNGTEGGVQPKRRVMATKPCPGRQALLAVVVLWGQLASAGSADSLQAVGILIERAVAAKDVLGSCDESKYETCGTAFTHLFQAAELLYQTDRGRSRRVISLCRRLYSRNLEIRLLLAQLSCRFRDVSEATPNFVSAELVAEAICRESSCWNTQSGIFQLLVAAKTAFGMCMMETRNFAAASNKFRSALTWDGNLDAVAWHLGLACDYGQDWHGAVEAYSRWLRIHKGRDRLRTLPPRPPNKLVVAIFCLSRVEGMPQGWGPAALRQTGIGGSEEAVILLSRELTALGMHVEVYGHPPESEIGVDEHGVVWMPVHSFDPHGRPPHVFVSWRGYALATFGGASALNLLWLHDRVIPQLLSPAMLPHLGGILVLSSHHRAQLPVHAQAKAIQTRNGLEASFFRDGPNRGTEFIFASHPERGLEQLLEVWPVIRSGVAGAVLKVYHGFPPGYGDGGAPEEELRRMRARKAKVMSLLSQPGVHLIGMANQSVLAQAYADAGFWLYPTSMAETSCISAMKAMANGAFPITSRFSPSGLTETTGGFDRGPPAPGHGLTLESSPEHLRRWAEAVVEAAAGSEKLAARRKEMKAWARQRYSWRGVAEDWNTMLRQMLHPGPRSLLSWSPPPAGAADV